MAEDAAIPACAVPAFDPACPWAHLRHYTAARLALGRAGGSLRTAAALQFQLDHAIAREAVRASFAPAGLAAQLSGGPVAAWILASRAPDRATYLRRPDWGRQLTDESRLRLESWAAAQSAWQDSVTADPADTAPVPGRLLVLVSDGLSAPAVAAHGARLVQALLPRLRDAGLSLAPLCLVPLARVGIINDAAPAARAELALILLGERPGLGSNDSLGAYFGYRPGPGRTDADRNCLSNIRPSGLAPELAAGILARQIARSHQLRRSGPSLPFDPEPGLPTALA